MIKFLIIGNQNTIAHNEIFPYIKNNQLWLGLNKISVFEMSNSYPLNGQSFEMDGKKYAKFGSICWFTNIQHNKNQEPLQLTKKYNPEEYPKYDYFDAIEVSNVNDIPIDYYGVMGVPITFLYKYCNSQFEIIDAAKRYLVLDYFKVNDKVAKEHKLCTDINGKSKYARILIKRIK